MTDDRLERRVTVHQLRIFMAVADLRSFTRAAERLHLSQPAVSHQVKALAAAVGSHVFETVGRRVQPTEVGRLLYAHAGRILAEFEAADRAIDELRGLGRGVLRLSLGVAALTRFGCGYYLSGCNTSNSSTTKRCTRPLTAPFAAFVPHYALCTYSGG